MRVRLCAMLASFALAAACPSVRAQVGSLDRVVRLDETSADLVNVLAQVAWLSQLPIIAELAQPLPKVQIAEGSHSVEYLLQTIAQQSPGHQWEAEGKAVHFYNEKLKGAKSNFLNLTFPRFTMPGNISELKLTFAAREYGLMQGHSGGGIVTTGFGDAVLEKDLLQHTVLENITGREILLRATNESPTFFTAIIFPNAAPTKRQMELDMNRNWFWQALKGQRPGHLYVQAPAAEHQ
jgi:hypothetical protein